MGTNTEHAENNQLTATPALSETETPSNPYAKDPLVQPLEWTNKLKNQVLKEKPAKETLASFSVCEFEDRQIILAEVRMLEKETNLKALPAALVLVPVAVAIIGASARSVEAFVPLWISLLTITVYVVIAAGLILWAMKLHVRKETCLTAWTKAFEESHARETKNEEDQMKAKFAAFLKAAHVCPTADTETSTLALAGG